jgi:conjugal transfer pilin signal peptidase TrbI
MLSLAWNLTRGAAAELRLLPLRAAVALGSSGLGQPPRPDQLFKAYCIVLPVGLATWWAIPQMTLVMSPSIDAWAVRANPGPIRRGDLVSFDLLNPVSGPKPMSVTKYALCLPGDRLTMVERPALFQRAPNGYYYCNSRLIGVSKPQGRKGQRLIHFHPDADIVPAGEVYVGSSHPDGFDSRYYGLVEVGRLTRMERVL